MVLFGVPAVDGARDVPLARDCMLSDLCQRRNSADLAIRFDSRDVRVGQPAGKLSSLGVAACRVLGTFARAHSLRRMFRGYCFSYISPLTHSSEARGAPAKTTIFAMDEVVDCGPI
jgi:hypothetical protein